MKDLLRIAERNLTIPYSTIRKIQKNPYLHASAHSTQISAISNTDRIKSGFCTVKQVKDVLRLVYVLCRKVFSEEFVFHIFLNCEQPKYTYLRNGEPKRNSTV